MSSSLQSTPYEKPTIIPSNNPSTLTRVLLDMVPENQPGTPTSSPRLVKPHLIPTDDKIPPACQYQRIRNMISTIYKYRYSIETRVTTAIDRLVHYEANAVIDTITVAYEEYPDLLHVPNQEYGQRNSQTTWAGYARGSVLECQLETTPISSFKKSVCQNTKR